MKLMISSRWIVRLERVGTELGWLVYGKEGSVKLMISSRWIVMMPLSEVGLGEGLESWVVDWAYGIIPCRPEGVIPFCHDSYK